MRSCRFAEWKWCGLILCVWLQRRTVLNYDFHWDVHGNSGAKDGQCYHDLHASPVQWSWSIEWARGVCEVFVSEYCVVARIYVESSRCQPIVGTTAAGHGHENKQGNGRGHGQAQRTRPEDQMRGFG